MKCRSTSVITWLTPLLSTATKTNLVSGFILLFVIWLQWYKISKIKKKNWIFRFIGPSWNQILLILISPIGLENFSNGSWTKFSEKSLLFKWLRHFLRALSHWFLFAGICCCFHSHKTYCDVLSITYAWQISFLSNQGTTERIYWLPSKAIGFNAC